MSDWKLVPVEPTEEMVRMGAYTVDSNGGNARWSDVREAWAEMLAAAPPAPSAEPVAWLYQHGETGRTRIVLPDQVFTDGPGQWLLVSPLYAAPPDHREAMRMALDWLIAEQRAGDEDCGDPRCDECEGVTRPRQRVIDALRAALGEE